MLISCWKLVPEQVAIFILERKLKKKINYSSLHFGTLPVSAFTEQQAPCSLPGAAAELWSGGRYPKRKRAAGILQGLFLDLIPPLPIPLRMGVLCKREKKYFRKCCSELKTVSYGGWVFALCSTVWVTFLSLFPSSINYLVFFKAVGLP